MKTKPILLDLFCGAGGAAMGYDRAGFQVIGVDIKPQPHYPFAFVQDDAMNYLLKITKKNRYAAIHASPPCQGYSRMRHLPWLKGKNYPMLIEATRTALEKIDKPWIMENVEDAPMGGVVLCGSMFGLKVYRHRRFESSHLIMCPSHESHRESIGGGTSKGLFCGRNKTEKGTLNRNYHSEGVMTIGGHNFNLAKGSKAMGIDWMTRDELAQAIPPAYTEYLGAQLMTFIR